MKLLTKVMGLTALMCASSAYSLEFCPNQEAIDEGGFYKSVETCEYEQVQVNPQTKCHYRGKVEGFLLSDVTTAPGHNTCSPDLYVEHTECGYTAGTNGNLDNGPLNPDGTPMLDGNGRPRSNNTQPLEPTSGTYGCTDYTGNIPLVSQEWTSQTQTVKIEGSCSMQRTWVRCKP